MKKVRNIVIALLALLVALVGCGAKKVEKEENKLPEIQENEVIQEVEENNSRYEIFEAEKAGDHYNFQRIASDIDHDGKREEIHIGYGAGECVINIKKDEKMYMIYNDPMGIYFVDNLENGEEELYFISYLADGLCYESAWLYKIDGLTDVVDNEIGEIAVSEIFGYDCDVEEEQRLRAEINEGPDDDREEVFEKYVDAHTLEYNIDGVKVSEEEYRNAVEKWSLTHKIVGQATFSESFDDLLEIMGF